MNSILIIVLFALFSASLANISYNENNAREILKYAIISYCDMNKVEQWNCGSLCQENTFQKVKIFYNKSHDAFAFTGYDSQKNSIIASFRGSENDINAMYDLDYPKESYPYCNQCYVHNGLYKEYNSLVAAGIMQEIRNLKQIYPQAKMIVTGHSLGAAMATFAALEVQLKITQVDQLITFGCPRLGNQLFANFVQQSLTTYFRLVHFKDPVPQLPLQIMGFKNPGVEIWYADIESSYYVICQNGESTACSDQFNLSGLKIWNINQHFNYLNMTIGPNGCK